MKKYEAGKCDIAVIGAGHAGIEAAIAAARLGMSVICFSINLDSVGNLPCNPSIGGTAKAQLVRELDALGGRMAKIADRAAIQYRALNTGKGPAVRSTRTQTDRRRYQELMKHELEQQENLRLIQTEIVEVECEDGKLSAVISSGGGVYSCRALIIASGTFLGGVITVGESRIESGPDGLKPATELSKSLESLGLSLRRFKTGTPPRINRRSVNFELMEVQEGDSDPIPFSYSTDFEPNNTALCHLTYTNEKTHEILRENISLSPIYSGVIEGVGPRYCPSIETKIMVFPDKKRHQVFLEPMGENTEELYVQGMSSSMPEEVQLRAMKSIRGLEQVEISRFGYAIEYDCIDPRELYPTMELKAIENIYGAGQFNGSSGYEEAAVQGFVAGVNAARKLKGEEPFILERSDGYIGILIDDLCTKGTPEPYRMLTSRSEYRLIHRQDNADIRMREKGYKLGLVSLEELNETLEKYKQVDEEIARLEKHHIGPTKELEELLDTFDEKLPPSGISLASLIRRPRVTYESLAPFDPERPQLSKEIIEQVEINIKYEGYIKRQLKQIEEFKKSEGRALPENLDYSEIKGMRTEAIEKLSHIRPNNIGMASRVSGVSPADMAALMLHLERRARGI